MEIDLLQLLRDAPELVLFVVLGLGYWIGNLGLGSIKLGPVTGVLLAGLLFGYAGMGGEDTPATSIGFMLFIYSVGLQAGPRFFSVLLEDGTRYVALVLVTAATAIAVVLFVSAQLDLSAGTAAGVLAGGLTSTPTLAAAQDAVQSGLANVPAGATRAEMLDEIAVGYAIAYLFGMIGLLALVRLAPVLLRVDLAEEARAQSRDMRLRDSEEEGEALARRWQPLVRSYEVVEGEATAGTLREIDLPGRLGCLIQQIKRDGQLVAPGPDLTLRPGDRVLVMGEVAAQQRAADGLGRLVLDPDLLDLPTEAREVVVTSSEAAGRSIGELDLIHRFGCFIVGISRAQVELPVTPQLSVEKGDTLYAYGTRKGLDDVARELGHTEKKVYETDLLTFAFGIATGLFVGTIRLKIGDVDVGLGSAGGLLLSGILFGFLRSIHPTFGRVPRAARWVFMEFGLMLFMAGIGLRAGPTFVATAGTLGPPVALAALCVLAIPFVVGTLFGRYVLRLNAALLVGAMTGALTSTPALGLVNQLARSNVPSLGYAGTYAFANILLAFAGTALVRF